MDETNEPTVEPSQEPPAEAPDDSQEPTYQDWAELQAPVACSWCWALVPRDRAEEHTTMHLDLASTLRALRDDVITLQSAQSTA